MPLLDRFEFLKMGFDIAYHASREPQLLHIEVTTLERNTRRSAPLIFKRLIEFIIAGAGAGSAFAPGESFAERVSGPWEGPNAFVDACTEPGFAVMQTVDAHTSFSVELQSPVDTVMVDALKQLAMRWLMATAAYVDDDDRMVTRDRAELEKHLPVFEMESTRFTARFEEFLHAAAPSCAVLVNRVAAARVEGLPIVALGMNHPRFRAARVTARIPAAKKSATKKKAVARTKPVSQQKPPKRPAKKKTPRAKT